MISTIHVLLLLTIGLAAPGYGAVIGEEKPGFHRIGNVGNKVFYAAHHRLVADIEGALSYCQSAGMSLLSLRSAEETELIGNFMKESVANGGHEIVPIPEEQKLEAEGNTMGGGGGGEEYFTNVWLSAREDESGKWLWTGSGEPLSYAHWASDYPQTGTQPLCAYILYYGQSNWFTLECKYSLSIICQI